jgi:two-component system cell cycle sensor histidine kinase/response regulator CckA
LSPSNAVTPDRSEDFQVPPTSGDEGGRSVLIVDDEPDVGQLVADVLNEEGWDATTVCSTQEALQLLRSHSYRLVIADLLMPDGGGRRIMEEISTLQRAVPVLIISGTIGLGKDSICEMGAVHCLAKPFTINQIIEAAAEAAGLQG